MPVARITRFLSDPGAGPFESLALDAFAFQYRRVAPFRRLCERRGIHPDTIEDWRQIPAVPTSAFKTVELAAAPPVEVFRSSGTTGGERSVHRQPFPELYRAVIDASFPDVTMHAGKPDLFDVDVWLVTPQHRLEILTVLIDRNGMSRMLHDLGRLGIVKQKLAIV